MQCHVNHIKSQDKALLVPLLVPLPRMVSLIHICAHENSNYCSVILTPHIAYTVDFVCKEQPLNE